MGGIYTYRRQCGSVGNDLVKYYSWNNLNRCLRKLPHKRFPVFLAAKLCTVTTRKCPGLPASLDQALTNLCRLTLSSPSHLIFTLNVGTASIPKQQERPVYPGIKDKLRLV